MKVEIKSYHAVAVWKWDLPGKDDDSCGICPNPFEGACFDCKYPGDDCPPIMGECGHAFHLHCLQHWFEQEISQKRCAMCRQEFKVKAAEPTNAPTTSGRQPLEDQAMDTAR